jgi:hypothetical protein
MQNKGIDVEQVMEEVNRAVAAPHTLLADFWAAERPASPNVSFLYPPHSRSLAVNLDMVSRNWEIDPEFEIGSRRRGVGGVVVTIKKFTRGFLRWYINPIVHQVRKFNMLSPAPCTTSPTTWRRRPTGWPTSRRSRQSAGSPSWRRGSRG